MAYQGVLIILHCLTQPSRTEGVHSNETGNITFSQSLLKKLLSGLKQRRIPAEGCNYSQQWTPRSRTYQRVVHPWRWVVLHMEMPTRTIQPRATLHWRQPLAPFGLSGITLGHALFPSSTAPLLPVSLWDLLLLVQGTENSPGWVAPLR